MMDLILDLGSEGGSDGLVMNSGFGFGILDLGFGESCGDFGGWGWKIKGRKQGVFVDRKEMLASGR